MDHLKLVRVRTGSDSGLSVHLLLLFGQVEAVPLAQFDQTLHVAFGLSSEGLSVDLLLQKQEKPSEPMKKKN